MKVIENKKLTELLGVTIGVSVDNGSIIYVDDEENITDITNTILELVVASIEDNQTFILWDRKINISVCEIED